MVGDGMALNPDTQRGGLAASFAQLADGLGTLVSQHLQLARVELADDARVIGSLLARIALFVPFVVVGYALLNAAAAVALARWIPGELALLALGAVNLLGGGLGLYRAARQLRSRPILDRSLGELRSSAAALAHARQAPVEANDGR